MKLKIIRLEGCGLMCRDEQGNRCYLDPYVGCALSPEDISEEYLVGKTVEIPDDCIALTPTYAPQENQLKILQAQND